MYFWDYGKSVPFSIDDTNVKGPLFPLQQVLEILISYESYDDGDGSPECEFIPKSLPKQTESTDSEKKVRNPFF